MSGGHGNSLEAAGVDQPQKQIAPPPTPQTVLDIHTRARACIHARAHTHTHGVWCLCVCVCIGPRIVGGRVGGPGGQERQRQCGVRCVSASLSSVSGELIVSGELMAGKKFGQTFSKVNILVHVCWKTTLCRLFFPHEFLPRGELRFYYLTKNNLNQINPN